MTSAHSPPNPSERCHCCLHWVLRQCLKFLVKVPKTHRMGKALKPFKICTGNAGIFPLLPEPFPQKFSSELLQKLCLVQSHRCSTQLTALPSSKDSKAPSCRFSISGCFEHFFFLMSLETRQCSSKACLTPIPRSIQLFHSLS